MIVTVGKQEDSCIDRNGHSVPGPWTVLSQEMEVDRQGDEQGWLGMEEW